MNKLFKKTLLSVLGIAMLTTLSTNGLKAQVTIGSGDNPVSGALLQLKDGTTSAGNPLVNASKGLGMPRVKLTDKNKLYPMLSVGYNAAEDAKHAGLVVYSTNQCAPFGPGLYVWDGTQWQGINTATPSLPPSLNITQTTLDIPSGMDARTMTAQTLPFTWAGSQITWSNPVATTGGSYSGGLLFGGSTTPTPTGITPASQNWTTSPASLSVLPDAMTSALVTTANPWRTRESKTTIAAPGNDCGAASETITLNQTNYAILSYNDAMGVAGAQNNLSTASNYFFLTDATAINFHINSNVTWKTTLAGNTSIFTHTIPATGGTDLTNGTAKRVSTPTLTGVTSADTKYQTATITIEDSATPKRANDVTVTCYSCVGTDPTMVQWRNALVATNGGTLAIDTPGANGVAWHQDHEGNIFFSMNYDATNLTGNNNRWMITNLATQTYGARTGGTAWTAPILTNTYANTSSPYTDAYWGYPGGSSASDASKYTANARLGLLYNWAAANGNQNPSTTDQGNTAHAGVQGICPAGWHLPTDLEWTQLENEIVANTATYSSTPNIATGALPNTTGLRGTLHGDAMKDTCEPYVGRGTSHSPLSGGFVALLAGYAHSGSSNYLGSDAWFWSSSSSNSSAAWNRFLYSAGSAVARVGYPRHYLFSVRCKKD